MRNEDHFWTDLERAFADDDNRRFDNARASKEQRRKDRLLMIGMGAGILLSVFAAFYVAGVIIFSSMPLPKTGWHDYHYSTQDRADLTELVTALR